MAQSRIEAFIATSSTPVTGSIFKITATGDNDLVISRIEFGTHVEPVAATTASSVYTTDFKVLKGESIDGPICKFKIDSGIAIVYKHI